MGTNRHEFVLVVLFYSLRKNVSASARRSLADTKVEAGVYFPKSATFAADTNLHQVFADDELAGKVALRSHQVRAWRMARCDVR